MILSHKIQLEPTVKQRIALAKACGCARFAFNWGLAEWQKQHDAGENPTANKIKIKFNEVKGEKYPWIYESPKDANQQAFANLNNAFQRFFKKKGGYPKFKKRGVHDSFYISNDKFSTEGFVVKLPLIGEVQMFEKLRFNGKIQSGVVSRISDKWFLSISVDVVNKKKKPTGKRNKMIGVDVGIKDFAVTSNGEKFEGPKALRNNLKTMKRESRSFSRKQKGSNRHRKQKDKIAKLHYRIKCVRNDFINKLTTRLCRENQAIVIEDLAVSNMLKNRKLSRAISDCGWGEFKRQIDYKSRLFGTKLLFADRFYASSKTCSRCGAVKESLSLNERVFHCPECGFSIDRDVNAAKNLCTLGLRGRARGADTPVRNRCEARTKPLVRIPYLTTH
jgi:putative transposase